MNRDVLDAFRQLAEKVQSEEQSDMMPMMPLYRDNVIAFAGIDKAAERRYFYLEIPDGPWDEDQMKALPKWNGLLIKMEYHEAFGPLKNRYFLEFIQGNEETGDLFEVVMQNMFDHILGRDYEEPLFTVIYKVLEKWKSFFKRGGYKKLSDDQQRGLFGELWFMKRWMQQNPGQPPLLLEGWGGPLSDRIDFKARGWGVEIKTAVDRLNKKVRISNEKQLKKTEAVPNISLYVCYLEVSRTIGTSLQQLVDDLREQFSSFSPQLLLKFNDKLTEAGFQDDEYTDLLMNVLEEEGYEVKDGFPILSEDLLPIGISHVSYSIDLTHCISYQMDINKIYELM
jgi:Putative  PD-(D/E)XK family member, (DUF4420)